MSAATEIANAEADAVEAELGPDEELEPDGEQEAETEPEPEVESEASTLRRIKEINDKVDREDARHATRYREIMGEDFDTTYKECPLCQLAGWAFPYDGQMLKDQRAVVALVLGEDLAQELKHSPYSRTCDTCAGAGVYLTGATAEHSRVLACEVCGGNGWLSVPKSIPVPALAAVPTPAALPPVQVSDPNATFDQWGREPSHPHFGMDPRYVR